MGQSKNTASSISYSHEVICRIRRFVFIGLSLVSIHSAQAFSGATVPWTTYEAENMTISGGQILGPPQRVVDNNAAATNTVDMEASGRQCVRLAAAGQYIQFAAQATANAIVVRYSVPDTANGTGANYTLSLYLNGTFLQKIPMTSMYSWLYGGYPFQNTPGAGTPRNFYNEARLLGLTINPGDLVRLQVDAGDIAPNYDIDLVDLENVAVPPTAPVNSLNVTAAPYNADPNGVADSTAALQNCINAASGAGKTVWMPAGTYLITGTINLPANTTVQGAGMWHTALLAVCPSITRVPPDGSR